jgi:hypothetical protein
MDITQTSRWPQFPSHKAMKRTSGPHYLPPSWTVSTNHKKVGHEQANSKRIRCDVGQQKQQKHRKKEKEKEYSITSTLRLSYVIFEFPCTDSSRSKKGKEREIRWGTVHS